MESGKYLRQTFKPLYSKKYHHVCGINGITEGLILNQLWKKNLLQTDL